MLIPRCVKQTQGSGRAKKVLSLDGCKIEDKEDVEGIRGRRGSWSWGWGRGLVRYNVVRERVPVADRYQMLKGIDVVLYTRVITTCGVAQSDRTWFNNKTQPSLPPITNRTPPLLVVAARRFSSAKASMAKAVFFLRSKRFNDKKVFRLLPQVVRNSSESRSTRESARLTTQSMETPARLEQEQAHRMHQGLYPGTQLRGT